VNISHYTLRLPSGHVLTFPASPRWEPASEAAFDALRLHCGATLSRIDDAGERVLAQRVSGPRPKAMRGKRIGRAA
jgi:hypothetical protein